MTDPIDQGSAPQDDAVHAAKAGRAEPSASAAPGPTPMETAGAAAAASRAEASARWGSMLAGLQAQADAPPQQPRFNPHPAGEIWPGSATAAVRDFLRRRSEIHPGGWITRHLIVDGTGRTGKSVDWALIFLRANKLVEASEDPRNARYLRYRLVPLDSTTKP